ncbi:redox-sensitive transcriptional activator SoxR [Austwickia sp. TVS 96-490-7B]|uniref:redox-sensitive transcriptional activator SoxR n=1 Tax=Austwickia sp. TVS 96-490-7B TaxID=2830843 RepID=UPI001C5914FF|nr:redox-sensitive transcriptional activator SoxR [Austwickia sp. TVS 96-490-7B]
MPRRRSTHDLLPIGVFAQRAGVTVATVRYYEEQGLIFSTRSTGNQRRIPRHALRRVAFVRAGQRCGLSLAEIKSALDLLPQDEPPSKKDWKKLGAAWHDMLQERIDALIALRDTTNECIVCGCLSTKNCAIYNPEDLHGQEGPGAHRWLPE